MNFLSGPLLKNMAAPARGSGLPRAAGRTPGVVGSMDQNQGDREEGETP
ncbi:MAG: hypothetical protein HY719_12670 [Planctomycetes bacterium]|nr:hypothetical protein [Planctomycetota bacterium]